MNIVVTGSTKGIGMAVVEALAPLASRLFLTARTAADLTEQARNLKDGFPELHIYSKAADFRHMAEVKAFGDFILAHCTAIDILVNNAGIYLAGSIHNEPEGRLEEMMDVNLYSVYHLTRSLLPTMIEAGKGHIFNLCSIASIQAYPNGGSYSISKYALLGFTKNLRTELKQYGIKVTAILPGATWSDSWRGVDLPYDRLMEAKDIANAILSASTMGSSAVVEEIIIRPMLGDLE